MFLHLVGVPRLGHGLHEQLAPLAVVLDVRRETPLVSDVAGVSAVLVLDHGLQRVVALKTKQAASSKKLIKRTCLQPKRAHSIIQYVPGYLAGIYCTCSEASTLHGNTF